MERKNERVRIWNNVRVNLLDNVRHNMRRSVWINVRDNVDRNVRLNVLTPINEAVKAKLEHGTTAQHPVPRPRITDMEPIDQYVNRNYSRPEQPERPFNEDDLRYLIQHLDNNIRTLEGSRDVGGRNYLSFHDGVNLNRFKFMRKIVEEWRIMKGSAQEQA